MAPVSSTGAIFMPFVEKLTYEDICGKLWITLVIQWVTALGAVS
jgi:hypothetical protein